MPSAKLIKNLEKEGFFLEFPDYESKEEIIIDIIREKNSRLSLSLPLFLKEEIAYKKIISKLSAVQKKELDKAVLISKEIYKKEDIQSNLKEIIKKNKIKAVFSKQEFQECYNSFKESQSRLKCNEQKIIEKQSKLRLNLDLNKSLTVLFSPAKIRIMEKIFNHEKLTNTELKYYYKAISSINKAVLNPSMQDYLRIIEITKKFADNSNKHK
ncbi:MAG: hypothetical protein AABX07_00295 [Nanoarchaeota archaeon]